MPSFIIKQTQARKIILDAAGLSKKASFGKGREAVYKLIDQLGFVQIDTNYVVERAHHHSIATRVSDYRAEWLEELMADGRIFEFRLADSGYIPMKDFRFSLPLKESFAHHNKVPQAELNLMNKVEDRIAREGPLMVKDFENDRQEASSGWWNWRPAKMALERLYFGGRLMITRKKDFQKLYDLPANLIPEGTDTTMPTPEEFARHIILRTLLALGIAYDKEIRWRAYRVKNNLIRQELKKMVEEGIICQVAIEGFKSAPLYMLPKYKTKKITLAGDAYILSPFDVLNVFRHRLRDFFNFDYQIECFVPEPKRKYGYFSLPVLVGDSFVARMDSKADRKQRILTIHNLHFESVKLTKIMITKLVDAIQDFAKFNQCEQVVITKSNKKEYLKAIKAAL